jgi:hypothetical protein
MSLALELGTKPEGTIAITPHPRVILIGELEITTDDFCQLVIYVLTNTNLVHADPRLHLMQQLAKLNVINGHGGNGFRLG